MYTVYVLLAAFYIVSSVTCVQCPRVLYLLTCIAVTCHVDLGLYPADGLVVREKILMYCLLLSLDLNHMVPQSLQTRAHLRGRVRGEENANLKYLSLSYSIEKGIT